MLAQDQFVDLYELLEVPPDADMGRLRERINKLYLEAQRNLDHHNFRKRFYYQELFEVHLPNAHQFLLDSAQRATYDRYLKAFKAGEPFPTELEAEPEPEPGEAVEGLPAMMEGAEASGTAVDVLPTRDTVEGVMPTADSVDTVLPTTDESRIAHESAAAPGAPSREELWKKWKSGLDHSIKEEESNGPRAAAGPATAKPWKVPPAGKRPAPKPQPTLKPAAPARPQPVPATPPKAARPAPVPTEPPIVRTTPPAPASVPPVTAPAAPTVTPAVAVQPAPPRQATSAASAPIAAIKHKPWVGIDTKEIERRRDTKRRELIKQELQQAGTTWSLLSGIGVFAVGIALLLKMNDAMIHAGQTTFGGSRAIITLVGAVIVIEAAVLGSRAVSRSVRRRVVATLSKMPYDELLRRCR